MTRSSVIMVLGIFYTLNWCIRKINPLNRSRVFAVGLQQIAKRFPFLRIAQLESVRNPRAPVLHVVQELPKSSIKQVRMFPKMGNILIKWTVMQMRFGIG